MSTRGITPTSVTAGALQVTDTFETFIQAGMMVSQTGEITLGAQIVGAGDPVDGGLTRGTRQIVVLHRYLVSGTDRDDARATVKALYDPRHGEQTLTFSFDNVTYTARVRLVKLTPGDQPNRDYDKGLWELRSHVYHKSTADTASDTGLSASPASVAVTNAGNVAAVDVQITITPTATKAAGDGQRYWHPITVVPKCPRGGFMPLELTGSGWNHAAEVAATRSLSTGYDVEIYKANKRIPVWAGAGSRGFNTSTTDLWIGDDVPPMLRWRISANLTDAQTSIAFLDEIGDMPPVPFPMQIGSAEVVTVTAKDETARSVTVVRGQRKTTAAAVTKGSFPYAYRGVAYDLVYGWTSAPNPEYDSRFKPIPAEHAGSTNSRWYFTNYQEMAATNDVSRPYPRPGSWGLVYDEQIRARQDMYVTWIPSCGASIGTNATPATSLQIGYLKAGAKPSQPLAYGWSLPTVVAQTSVVYDQVTTLLAFGGAGLYEGRLEVRGITPDGADYRSAVHFASSAAGNTASMSGGVIESMFLLHPYDPTNREYVTSASTPGWPTDNDGFRVTNVNVVFSSTEVPTVIMGTTYRTAYQFGRPDAPAQVKSVDPTAANERVLYLYGPIVAINEDLSIDVATGVVADNENRGFGNVWSGELPEIYAGAGTVKYVDATIGTVDMSIDVKAARN